MSRPTIADSKQGLRNIQALCSDLEHLNQTDELIARRAKLKKVCEEWEQKIRRWSQQCPK